MATLRVRALMLVGAAALAGACTTPAEPARPAPSRSAGETTTTTAPRSIEADTKLAKGALMNADIPRGRWFQTADPEQPQQRTGSDLACDDPPADFALYDDPAQSVTVASALFVEEGGKRTFREVVRVFASVEEAQRFGAVIRDPKFRTCTFDTFVKVAKKLREGINPSDPATTLAQPTTTIDFSEVLQINDFAMAPAGDEALALEFKSGLNMSMPGRASTIINTYTRVGRAYVVVELNCDKLPTADEVHDFADAAAEKLRKALADA